LLGLTHSEISRITGLDGHVVDGLFIGSRKVRRSSFARAVEVIRSTYEAKKNKLTKFENAYVKSWMKEWLRITIESGVQVEMPGKQSKTNKALIAQRNRCIKQRRRLLKSIAYDWVTTDEVSK
jgi:hypothetical protein